MSPKLHCLRPETDLGAHEEQPRGCQTSASGDPLAAEPSGGLATILVVDDEEGIRQLFKEILAGAGYEVVLAGNGSEALKILRGRNVHLVITDILMPETEGIEMIRTVRRSFPGLRTIAVSGAFDGHFLRIARLLGARAALAKPVSPTQLLGAVREVLA